MQFSSYFGNFKVVARLDRLLVIKCSQFCRAIQTHFNKGEPGGRVLPRILDRGVPRRFLNPNPI